MNNIILALSDLNGNVKATTSAGTVGEHKAPGAKRHRQGMRQPQSLCLKPRPLATVIKLM
jgi:hypothetical protein